MCIRDRPYTNELAREKVFDLVDKLRHYTHGSIRVHVINFTKLQLAVYDNCDESYAMTVMRRMMSVSYTHLDVYKRQGLW